MDSKTFLKRTGATIVLSLITVGVTYLCPMWLFSVIVCAFIAAALFEYFTMVERKGIFVYKYYGIAIGAFVPLLTYSRFGVVSHEIQPFFIVMISLFVIVLQFTRRTNVNALNGIASTLFGILYIGWFLGYLVKIRLFPNGSNLIMFLIVVTKGADIGAYVVGSLMGRHSLIPRVSPKKSVEGFLGALVASTAIAVLARPLSGFSLYHVSILGLFLGLLGQMGDLSESLIKRDCQTKDSSAIVPGIGGVLDLVDSLLFTAPIFYFYLTIIFSLKVG